ncbi:hypothetical protein H696_00788 [Fonticula alba]|uniref:DNA/RNA-binding protein Alba-like domain-containing protein n=1 Tax=Fonticula alba TaxID=691883 RepID=A0A058ZI97_FONAL|nr:hypothetical protein H696_00788 [Fonticula alba]KCV73247.1 hypothetical protein H696_00788 [Fonticula alba]|eukprot:XP_009492948.1 hypothetical protein H696_00788 [Fonticula alba]
MTPVSENATEPLTMDDMNTVRISPNGPLKNYVTAISTLLLEIQLPVVFVTAHSSVLPRLVSVIELAKRAIQEKLGPRGGAEQLFCHIQLSEERQLDTWSPRDKASALDTYEDAAATAAAAG